MITILLDKFYLCAISRFLCMYKFTFYSFRQQALLANRKLSALTHVPHSLVAGLKRGGRRNGELLAREIGPALGLASGSLDTFIFAADDMCTERVWEEPKAYHSRLLNMAAGQLRLAGILPDDPTVFHLTRDDSPQILELHLQDGSFAQLASNLIFPNPPVSRLTIHPRYPTL